MRDPRIFEGKTLGFPARNSDEWFSGGCSGFAEPCWKREYVHLAKCKMEWHRFAFWE